MLRCQVGSHTSPYYERMLGRACVVRRRRQGLRRILAIRHAAQDPGQGCAKRTATGGLALTRGRGMAPASAVIMSRLEELELGVPESVHEMIEKQIDRLTPEQQEVLE